MNAIPIVKERSIEVVDARTQTRKFTICLEGTVVGNPVVSGNLITLTVQERGRRVTYVYDYTTGMRKNTLPGG